MRDVLDLGEPAQIVCGAVVDVDHAGRQTAADRDLVHVDRVGGVEEAALRCHGEAGDGVVAALGGDRGALQRIECDVELRAFAGADRLADVEHRRLVPLALADHDDAVDVEHVQGLPHGVDRGLVGGLLVATAHPACAASAAASVTRTESSARLRSSDFVLAHPPPFVQLTACCR